MKTEHQQAEEIRQTAPGYIGGKEIAEKATDGEVLALVKYQDELAKLHNRQIDIKRYYRNATTAIKMR